MEQIFLVKLMLDTVHILSFNSEQSYEAGSSKPTTLMRKLRLKGVTYIN